MTTTEQPTKTNDPQHSGPSLSTGLFILGIIVVGVLILIGFRAAAKQIDRFRGF